MKPVKKMKPVKDLKYEALLIASRNGNIKLVIKLLEHGADPNSRILSGKYYKRNTPLIFAAMHDNTTIVQLLLEHGADVNAQNDYGTTPLLAALQGDPLIATFGAKMGSAIALIKLLVKYGADPNIPNKKGTTAFLHACEYSMSLHKDTALLLLDPSLIDDPTLFQDKNVERNKLISIKKPKDAAGAMVNAADAAAVFVFKLSLIIIVAIYVVCLLYKYIWQ